MTQKSSEELEREAEAVRNRMTETAETLQRKLSPGELLDEIGTYLKNSDGPVALHNLKTQVRDNPLPLAFIGVGLAWLFMGGGPKTDAIAKKMNSSHDREGREPWGSAAYQMATGTNTDSAQSSVGDKANSALHSVGRHAQSAGEAINEAGRRASAKARYAGGNAQRMFSDTLEKEPLILGALGIAVGAAVGAMLPTSRVEEEVLAPYGAAAREGAMEAMSSSLERTKEAVSEAVGQPSEETDVGQRQQ